MPNVINVKANKYIWQSENALILKLLGLLSVKYSLTPQLCVREQSFCDYHYSFVFVLCQYCKKKSSFGTFQSRYAHVKIGVVFSTNLKLRQKTKCKVCVDSELELMLQPCNHLSCCRTCGFDKRVETFPVCRSPVERRDLQPWYTELVFK